jgi:hypothetical protein
MTQIESFKKNPQLRDMCTTLYTSFSTLHQYIHTCHVQVARRKIIVFLKTVAYKTVNTLIYVHVACSFNSTSQTVLF